MIWIRFLPVVFVSIFVCTDGFADNALKKFTNKFKSGPGEIEEFVGEWRGQAAIPGSEVYPILITLQEDEQGSWDYPSVGCSGTLLSKGVEKKSFVYWVRVSKGNCQDNLQLLLTPIETNQLKLELLDKEGEVGLTATLEREGGSQAANLAKNADASNPMLPKVPISGEMKFAAEVSKNANMRSGPSTDDGVVVVVPQGTQIAVAPIEGDWYQSHVVVDGQPYTGWIYKSLISTEMVELVPAVIGEEELAPGEVGVAYAGYSMHFQEVRELYREGELQKIEEVYSETESRAREKAEGDYKKLNKKIGLLRWLERGALSIDQGDFDSAEEYLTRSEDILDLENSRSRVGGFFNKATFKTAETLLGNEELSLYRPAGWETVLMLNYKTLAYLLQGDRRAYNVTRRAIDWQNIAKREFDQELAEENEKAEEKFQKEQAKLKKKIAKEEKKAEKMGEKLPEKSALTPEERLNQAMASLFMPLDKKAESVPSAYVNPFGFYVAGMVQEFESFSDQHLRDNARISYTKALELNPGSEVLAKAVEDMESSSGAGNVNMLHVIGSVGFAPEKKVATYMMMTDYGPMPMKLQLYDPVESTVDRIEVQSIAGKHLATLSTVADVEALCLRQQKDKSRSQMLEALSSYMVGAVVEGVGQEQSGLSGSMIRIFSKVRQEASAPDTRSWMSLPARIEAARLRMRKGVSQIKIVAFDKEGKELSQKTVDISPDSHGVVYIRSLGDVLFVHATENLWM